MPVAAIESLILLLSHPPPPTTISETLDLLANHTAILKRSVSNPISLSAGTDLFQRYLITSLQRGSGIPGGGSRGDFRAIGQHLLSNGRLFAKRANEARHTIAEYARRFVRDESVVLTNGGSRVVGAVLTAAAEAHKGVAPRFRVIYVSSAAARTESHRLIRQLRALAVPVAVIPESAVAYSMGMVSMVLVGAEGVVENGGIISRMGTYQMAILAHTAAKPVYVVVESHKFVRMFPLGQYDLPIEQKVLDFRTEQDVDEDEDVGGESGRGSGREARWEEKTPRVDERADYFEAVQEKKKTKKKDGGGGGRGRGGGGEGVEPGSPDAVDYTPPNLITALITEAGLLTPSAVSEELIKIWY